MYSDANADNTSRQVLEAHERKEKIPEVSYKVSESTNKTRRAAEKKIKKDGKLQSTGTHKGNKLTKKIHFYLYSLFIV